MAHCVVVVADTAIDKRLVDIRYLHVQSGGVVVERTVDPAPASKAGPEVSVAIVESA